MLYSRFGCSCTFSPFVYLHGNIFSDFFSKLILSSLFASLVNRVYFNEAAELKLSLVMTLGATSVFSAGRNIYCIDKNYGGALIIWDRMFGKHDQIWW